MGAETTVPVGSRPPCLGRLAALVEFGREQDSCPAWMNVWDVSR